MDELVAWFRAQLDDDERVARAATHGPWTTNGTSIWRTPSDEWDFRSHMQGKRMPFVALDPAETGDRNAQHIARWDPARVLAEVDAKRRILDEHPADEDGFCGDGLGLVGCKWAWPCPTVRLLALPFAGREGYRAEWRPTDDHA